MDKKDEIELKKMLNAIYKSDSASLIEDGFRSEFLKCSNHQDVTDLYNRYMPYLWLYRKANTVISKYAKLRKIIKECDTKNTEYALSVVSLGSQKNGLYNYVNEKQKAKVINQLETQEDVKIELKAIENIVQYLRDNLNNNFENIEIHRSQNKEMLRVYFTGMLLGLCTGRRLSEIFKTLKIYKQGAKTLYGGLLKKRGDEDKKMSSYLLFISQHEAKTRLKELRDLTKTRTENMTLDQVSNAYSSLMKSQLNKYIAPKLGRRGIDFKSLRVIYADCAFLIYGKGQERDFFIGKVLNHKFKMTPTKHYLT